MEIIMSDVENILDDYVISIERICNKNRLLECYCVTTKKGKRYCVKKVSIIPNKVELYKEIMHRNIEGFVTVYGMLATEKKNEFIIVTDWVDGVVPNLAYWKKDEESCVCLISKAAELIRNIHESMKTEKKIICDDTKMYEALSCKFLTVKQKDILYKYMKNNLTLINGRYKTIVHGDLHLDNICGSTHDVFFIDLGDVDLGDSYKDLVYAANIHKSQEEDMAYYIFLNKYFQDCVPPKFWSIVNCYSIIKILNIMNAEILQSDIGQATISIDTFIEQHGNMQNDVPLWYVSIERKMKNTYENG